MDRQQIKQLIEWIPLESPFIEGVTSSREADPAIGRTAYLRARCTARALNEPEFGWQFLQIFARLNAELPPGIDDRLVRTFEVIKSERRDDGVTEALALRMSMMEHTRKFVNALCLLKDITTQEMADLTHFSPDGLMIYEQLFWNVRDRMDELPYLAQLIWPQSRQVEMQPDYLFLENHADLMLRIAYSQDKEALLLFYGASRERCQEFNAQENAARLESMIMSTGVLTARLGGLHQKDFPSINTAKGIIAAAKQAGTEMKSDDELYGLASLTVGGSVMENVIRIHQPHIREVLRKQAQLYKSQEPAGPKKKELLPAAAV